MNDRYRKESWYGSSRKQIKDSRGAKINNLKLNIL
jgi:hypothetical protein